MNFPRVAENNKRYSVKTVPQITAPGLAALPKRPSAVRRFVLLYINPPFPPFCPLLSSSSFTLLFARRPICNALLSLSILYLLSFSARIRFSLLRYLTYLVRQFLLPN